MQNIDILKNKIKTKAGEIMFDLAITNGKVYLDGKYHETHVYIKDGIISEISDEHFEAKEVYSARGNLVLPGIIDPHVHFDLNLGFIRSVDNFYSGSVAAAWGGITTFIDFLDPVANKYDLKVALKRRLEEAKDSVIDYKFHATVKNPKGNVEEIVDEMKALSLSSVKVFTTYSNSNRRTYDNEIKKLLELSERDGFLILAHIENDELINLDEKLETKDLYESRNTLSETSEALKIAGYNRAIGGKLYMVHCSSGYTLKKLSEEYKDILNKSFFVESCPHYFTMTADLFKQEDGYLYTMAPPLRSADEVETIKEYFDNIHTIGTDHCPFLKEDKKHILLKDLPLGIGGVEQSFDIMYSLFKDKAIDKMTKNVAITHNLFPQKGIIQVGSDADILIYDNNNLRNIDSNHSRCNYSVYEGFEVSGKVVSTISRGKFIVKDNKFIGGEGKFLK